MAKKFTLGKQERLKSRKQIEQLFKQGKAFNLFPYRVFYSFEPPAKPGQDLANSQLLQTVKFGVGVSTRNFKRATDRNRIKRISREVWRLQKLALQEALLKHNSGIHVFLISTGKELPEYNFVYDKVGVVINKLIKIAHEKNAVDT